MEIYQNSEIINAGVGSDTTIKELSCAVMEVVGCAGELIFYSRYPDDTLKKLLDISYIAKLVWWAQTSLPEGLRKTNKWFQGNPWIEKN